MAQHVPDAVALRIKDERLSWCDYLCLGRDGSEEDYLCMTQTAALPSRLICEQLLLCLSPSPRARNTFLFEKKTLLKERTPPPPTKGVN